MASLTPAEKLSLQDISEYYAESVYAFHLVFGSLNPDFEVRYAINTMDEIRKMRVNRLTELDKLSGFAVLSSIEATLKVDYLIRCKDRKKDALSRRFRRIFKKKKERISFDTELIDSWAQEHPEYKQILGELRGAWRYRHWLAHGRYWLPKLGRKYDYFSLHSLAESIHNQLPLVSTDQYW